MSSQIPVAGLPRGTGNSLLRLSNEIVTVILVKIALEQNFLNECDVSTASMDLNGLYLDLWRHTNVLIIISSIINDVLVACDLTQVLAECPKKQVEFSYKVSLKFSIILILEP